MKKRILPYTPRKFAPVFVVAMLCLFLTACGAQTQTKSIGVVSNEETGTKISLGMTRDKVEELLYPIGKELVEKPKEQCKMWSAIYGKGEDQITVMYNWNTDIVQQIMVDLRDNDDYASHWTLDGSISLGASKEEIEKVYGICSESGERSLAYNYDINGERTDGMADIIVAFLLDESDRTCFINVVNTNFEQPG